MTKVDTKIAQYYSHLLLRPSKCGDNCLAVWLPGSGRRTIVSDIFSTKFVGRKVIYFSPADLPKIETLSVTRSALVVIEGMDGLDETARFQVLNLLGETATASGGRKINFLINIYDYPQFLRFAQKDHQMLKLAQRVVFCPGLDNELLNEKVDEYERTFEVNMSQAERREMFSYTGNTLSLVKQYVRYLREDPRGKTLEKLKGFWADFPQEYRENINHSDLARLNFSVQAGVFADICRITNPGMVLNGLLTPIERVLYRYLLKNPGLVLSRDQIIAEVYGENGASDWALDKLVSRLRKKIRTTGLENKLEVWKRRGLRWVG